MSTFHNTSLYLKVKESPPKNKVLGFDSLFDSQWAEEKDENEEIGGEEVEKNALEFSRKGVKTFFSNPLNC